MAQSSRRARLILQDGSVFEGESFGAEKSTSGECVFQTGKNLQFSFVFPPISQSLFQRNRHGRLSRVTHGPIVPWTNFGSFLSTDRVRDSGSVSNVN